jgi:hypothetical protein
MLSFYFNTLTRSISQPRHLFSHLPLDLGVGKPLGYLMISSMLFAAASAITALTNHPALFLSLYFMNAMGMTVIAAGLGYLVIFIIKAGQDVAFYQVFSIYAIASGTTLLAAWVPCFLIITEPWKWWLIGTGLKRSCRLTAIQVVWVIGLSAGVIVCAFRWVMPLTLSNQ